MATQQLLDDVPHAIDDLRDEPTGLGTAPQGTGLLKRGVPTRTLENHFAW